MEIQRWKVERRKELGKCQEQMTAGFDPHFVMKNNHKDALISLLQQPLCSNKNRTCENQLVSKVHSWKNGSIQVFYEKLSEGGASVEIHSSGSLS